MHTVVITRRLKKIVKYINITVNEFQKLNLEIMVYEIDTGIVS